MISSNFDMEEFESATADLDWHEIISAAQEEVATAERLTAGGRRGAPAARARGADRYAARLKSLIWFLSNWKMPRSNANTPMYMRIVERLVARGNFKPELFDVLGWPRPEGY